MYKKRLKSWAVRKYDTDATLGILLRCVKARQECGKASVILKNGQPYHIERIQSHILKKHTTADQLLRNTGPEVSMPPGFVCTTPQPTDPETFIPIEHDTMSDGECQSRLEISPSIRPTTASSTSESKGVLPHCHRNLLRLRTRVAEASLHPSHQIAQIKADSSPGNQCHMTGVTRMELVQMPHRTNIILAGPLTV
jgi:hypothetical protein